MKDHRGKVIVQMSLPNEFPGSPGSTGVVKHTKRFGNTNYLLYLYIVKLKQIIMKNGDRVELLQMVNDPNPIESGSMGVIMNIGGGVVNVRWDNKRDLGVIVGVDRFKVYKQVLFFDYFVDEETTNENVSINVIECKGEIYPDTIDPMLSSFVDELFLNGTIELGKVRDMGEEGDEYHVMIYEGDTEFLISYDVMVDEDNSHSPEYWDMSKEVKVPKGEYSFV